VNNTSARTAELRQAMEALADERELTRLRLPTNPRPIWRELMKRTGCGVQTAERVYWRWATNTLPNRGGDRKSDKFRMENEK